MFVSLPRHDCYTTLLQDRKFFRAHRSGATAVAPLEVAAALRSSPAGVSETSPVVLGGPRDAPLLGMVTLEALGLMLNPLTRELLPMKLLLAALTPRAA
jgi:hypothetical protein